MDKVGLVFIAILAGAAITLQGQFMGLMDKTIGTRESVFITYASGGLLASFIILLAKGGKLGIWKTVPWYAFTAGFLGLIIVGSIGYVVPRMGVAAAFTLILASQFGLAVLIDHYGLFGAEFRAFDITRAVGLVVLFIGVWLIIR